MKLAKYLNAVLLAVFACCISASISYAEEPLAKITIISTGKTINAEEVMYNPQQKVWEFTTVGSDKLQKIKEQDACVNTPAGLIYPGEKGTLVIDAGDVIGLIQLAYSANGLTVSMPKPIEGSEPLALVEDRRSSQTFEVPCMMSYDAAKDMWAFCEEGTTVTRTLGASSVNITTPAGEMMVFEGYLWVSWGKDDSRKDQLPMQFIGDTDGSWDIRHGLIGGE